MNPLIFNFRATTAEGQACTDRIEASSAAEALQLLRARGLRDVQLLDDEYSAIQPGSEGGQARLQFSAADELAFRQQPSLARRLLWSFGRNAWIWGPLLLWALYSAWSLGWQLPAWPAAALATFLLWFAWASVPQVLYHQAQEAGAWARWSEMEAWMRWLGRWQRWFRFPFAEHEMRFRTATAWAGLGRMPEAVALTAPLAADASLQPGFFACRQASLFIAAKDFRQAVALHEEAHRLRPTTSSAIDLAFARLRWLGETEGVRELLHGIQPAEHNAAVQCFFHYTQGLLALAEGRAREALDAIEQSLVAGRTYLGLLPGLQRLLLDARAHYGLALAQLGRLDEARPHLEAGYPMMKAHGDHALIARCREVLRRGAGPG